MTSLKETNRRLAAMNLADQHNHAVMPEARILVKDHIPCNKLRHQVRDSVCEVRVKDYDGTGPNQNAWTEISLSEIYTPDGSARQQCRTISVTLNAAERARLLAVLLRT